MYVAFHLLLSVDAHTLSLFRQSIYLLTGISISKHVGAGSCLFEIRNRRHVKYLFAFIEPISKATALTDGACRPARRPSIVA